MTIGFYDRCLRVLDDLKEIDKLHLRRLAETEGMGGPRPEAEAMQAAISFLDEAGWLENLHDDCQEPERQAEPESQED